MNMNYFQVMYNQVHNPMWLSGLIDGEGSFYVGISKRVSSAGKEYFVVTTQFYQGLHSIDAFVLEAIKDYLHCGAIYVKSGGTFHSFEIKAQGDLRDFLFPHQDLYSLSSIKRQDYLDFRAVSDMMANGTHLTPEGLEQIRSIKAGMNAARRTSFLANIDAGLI